LVEELEKSECKKKNETSDDTKSNEKLEEISVKSGEVVKRRDETFDIVKTESRP